MHIHAFEVHVLDVRRRICIDERRLILALPRSGKAGHIAWTGRRYVGVGVSQAAAIGAGPSGVGDMARAALHRFIGFPRGQCGLFLRRSVACQDLCCRPHMRVSVENLIPVACHTLSSSL